MHGVDLRERAAYVRAADALVLADPHVGRDEASGVQFPLGERADLDDRLGRLLGHFSPARVVVAGDVLHGFQSVSERARESLADLRATCEAAGASLSLVAGNHDVRLGDAWDGPVHDVLALGSDGTVVCHGHERPSHAESVERYLCGHAHPSITIEGHRRPCYLHGPGPDGSEVLVLPAFNRLAPGVEVNRLSTADLDTPLVADLEAFRPLIYDPDSQEVLSFPPLGEFRGLL